MSVRETIARNTFFNTCGRVWEALIGVVLMVYIVKRLDWGGYGLWSLAAAFTGYISLLDFGVSSAFTKYIAERHARDDQRGVSEIVNSGLAFYLALGAVMLAIGWPLVEPMMALVTRLLVFLHPRNAAAYENANTLAEARFLFRGALLLFVATNCIAPFTALQSGLQRMGVTNVVSFGASILKLGLTVYFLEAGFGIRGLIYANGAVLAAFAVVSVVVAYALHPPLRLRPRHVTRATLGRLMRFGWRTQVAKLANVLNFQTDRAIVGLVFSDLALVGLYRAGEELASKLRQAPALVVSALLPAASELDARKDQDRLARLYLLSTKYIAVVAVPLAIFSVAAADMLMHAMFANRENLAMAAWVLRILALGYAANLLPGPGVSIALGMGRADMPMYAGIISMLANLALTALLVYTAGFYGIPVATSLAFVLSALWFFRAMRRQVAVPLGQLCRMCLGWPVLAAMPGFLFCLGANAWMAESPLRGPNIAMLALTASIFGITYLLFLRWTPFLDAYDVGFLKDTLRLGRMPGFDLLTRRARHV